MSDRVTFTARIPASLLDEMLTLDDDAFLACTELAEADEGVEREFWTADQAVSRPLGANRAAYVRALA
jgi:hypothetical protein